MNKYKEIIRYLDTLVNYEKRGFKSSDVRGLGLERMGSALKKLNRPDIFYKAVHVAGTKGKGSVSTYTDCILREASLNVGLYTSPHLSTPRERIKFNGKNITRTELVESVNFLRGLLGEDISRGLTYFEFLTLTAMWYFSSRKADVAVFETGMGGRLDATNVIRPEACIITPVSHDHTRILGNTLEKIAREKAEIIKKGSVCVSSMQKKSPLKVIKEKCKRMRVPLFLEGRDIRTEPINFSIEGSVFNLTTPGGCYKACRISMPGVFQLSNAAVAAAACETLFRSVRKKDIPSDAVKKGISKAFIPARMEVLSKKPFFVVDGAHNDASARSLLESLKKAFIYRKLVLIVAFSKDKEIKRTCSVLSGAADSVIVTRARTPRSMDPAVLAGHFTENEISLAKNPREAVSEALSKADDADIILAVGSFYLAGEIREIMKGRKLL